MAKYAEAAKLHDNEKTQSLLAAVDEAQLAAQAQHNKDLANSAALDQEVIREYLAAKTPRHPLIEGSLAERLGVFAQVGGKLRPEDAAIVARYGDIQRAGIRLSFQIRFAQPTTGIPALLNWLSSRGCTKFTYFLNRSGPTID